MKTLLCASLVGPKARDIKWQIAKSLAKADLLELRLDLYPELQPEEVSHFLPLRPWILSVSLECSIGPWVKLKPTFVQVEVDELPELLKELKKHNLLARVILSRHGNREPEIKRLIPACFYKMAFPCTSAIEALDFFTTKKDLVGVAMGECGQFGRALSQKLQNGITFAAVNDKLCTAPGQLTLDELVDVYHVKEQTPKTRILALVGSPLNKSCGHIFHNEMLRRKNLDIRYVKVPLQLGELANFIEKAVELDFFGYSVTTPLKEEAASIAVYKDRCTLKTGAANTLLLKEGSLIAANTDGPAAAFCLERKLDLFGARVAILGAGATARAIGFSLMEKGATVTFFNRTLEKAKEAATQIGALGYSLFNFCPYGFEVVIQATSAADLPIDYTLPKDAVALEVIQGNTRFLSSAKASGCETISGRELFVAQAILQQEFWFSNEYSNYSKQSALAFEGASASF